MILTMRMRLFRYVLAGSLALGAASITLPAQAGPHLLVDVSNGRVLEQEDAFAPWYPASLTKLMTTYVAFRAIKAGEIQLDSPVRFSERASREPPSKMGYAPGAVLTVDNAIKLLMVKSANDVATAVAESLSGSVAGFAKRMNEEARRIGMTDTNFVNAHGLHDDAQVTTARDLAVLAMTMRNEFPEYLDYFSLEALSAANQTMENHNTLIRRFEGADGMKTGYTCPSGFNLIATATRNGRSLMAVVIGAHSVEERGDLAANLLADGFQTSRSDLPFLGQLQRTGSEPGQAVNLRNTICTEAHWNAVAEKRGPSGQPAFTSPHLSEPDRPPITVAVSLGGATGPESSAPQYADVPVPTPRPNFTPEMASGG